jgi:hypothetical protein
VHHIDCAVPAYAGGRLSLTSRTRTASCHSSLRSSVCITSPLAVLQRHSIILRKASGHRCSGVCFIVGSNYRHLRERDGDWPCFTHSLHSAMERDREREPPSCRAALLPPPTPTTGHVLQRKSRILLHGSYRRLASSGFFLAWQIFNYTCTSLFSSRISVYLRGSFHILHKLNQFDLLLRIVGPIITRVNA